MATYRPYVATPSRSATSLYSQNTREEVPGLLATNISHRHQIPFFEVSLPHPADVVNMFKFVTLGNPDRACSIELLATSSLLEKVTWAMWLPFPALKNLCLLPRDIGTPIISHGFLGASAPGLPNIYLGGKLSSALPKPLLSRRDLMDLPLLGVPNPDHISPEVIVTSLSNLSRLKILEIGFSTPRPSRSSHLPPHPRSTLSALSGFTFSGSSEYLEDLIARIDTPFLQRIIMNFCHRLTDAPQLRQLICRTEGLRSPDQATLIKRARAISLWFCQTGRLTGSLTVRYPSPIIYLVHWQSQNWQITSVAQTCLQSMPLPSGVKQLIVDSTKDSTIE